MLQEPTKSHRCPNSEQLIWQSTLKNVGSNIHIQAIVDLGLQAAQVFPYAKDTGHELRFISGNPSLCEHFRRAGFEIGYGGFAALESLWRDVRIERKTCQIISCPRYICDDVSDFHVFSLLRNLGDIRCVTLCSSLRIYVACLTPRDGDTCRKSSALFEAGLLPN